LKSLKKNRFNPYFFSLKNYIDSVRFVIAMKTVLLLLACILLFTACSKEPAPIPNNDTQAVFCGGIAGFACPEGYVCELDGTYPDAGGHCVSKLGATELPRDYCEQASDCVIEPSCCDCGLGTWVNKEYQTEIKCSGPLCKCALQPRHAECENNHCVGKAGEI
jgi:hypothetical protein